MTRGKEIENRPCAMLTSECQINEEMCFLFLFFSSVLNYTGGGGNSSLNTPVVPLQTPGLSGLYQSSYSGHGGVGGGGAQGQPDFTLICKNGRNTVVADKRKNATSFQLAILPILLSHIFAYFIFIV